MAIWTLDKFVRQEHTSAVFQKFYMMPDLSQSFSYLIGMIQGLIVLGVIVGFKKKFTYGATLILHTISTLNSYSQYLNPWEGANILFFVAWPMLAATLALFLLREYDTTCTVGKKLA